MNYAVLTLKQFPVSPAVLLSAQLPRYDTRYILTLKHKLSNSSPSSLSSTSASSNISNSIIVIRELSITDYFDSDGLFLKSAFENDVKALITEFQQKEQAAGLVKVKTA